MAIHYWLLAACSFFGSTAFFVQRANLRRGASVWDLSDFTLAGRVRIRKHAAQGLDASKRRCWICILSDQPQKANPCTLVLRQVFKLGMEDRSWGAGHFPKIPRIEDLARDVSVGSVSPEASRIAFIQSTSLRVTSVPNTSSTTGRVVS